MTHRIKVAAVEDNRLFADGLQIWANCATNICLLAITATVDQLLNLDIGRVDVILLSPALRGEPGFESNVRKLISAGHRILVIDTSPWPTMVAKAVSAGAHGYLTRDNDLADLASTLRVIASGSTAWALRGKRRSDSGEPPASSQAPALPTLSEREHMVLMTYVSGMTLNSTARRLGISEETARTYLKRVKEKYERAGRPARTKLDLADRVRADGIRHRPECPPDWGQDTGPSPA
jgi:two-component system, NarL family, nitrate/nitrite response regulator NarL